MWGQNKEDIEKRMECLERGCAVIDLDAIEHNMDSMHDKLKPGTKMMGVIKTDGYGHGAVQIAHILENKDYLFGFATATAEEAFELRDAGITKPILILGYTFPYSYEKLTQLEIRPAVFRRDMADELCKAAAKTGKKIKVHIKVDTGMGRIGITPGDAGIEFVKYVLSKPELEVEGIFTHFAKADEYDKTSAKKQYALFSNFCERIEKELGYRVPVRHCSNSAGILELPEVHMDMVRAGITMYGLMPSDEVNAEPFSLKPVMSLKSHISYIKTIHLGQSVSYGGLFIADRDTLVATVPLGYGDGYPRMLTGKGHVLINGTKCPILGRICMDQFMVDVTHVEGVKEGNEVVLLGSQGNETITAEEIGNLSGRFNYEFVCLITKRVPRAYIYKGEVVYIK